MITAEGDSGLQVVMSRWMLIQVLAQIIVDNATIKGSSGALQAASSHATISVYENPLGTAETDIQIVDGAALVADDNITIETTALQDRPDIQATSWWPLMHVKPSTALILMIPR